MRVCFVGLGSIAKRHISNLKDMFGDAIEIDVLRHSTKNEVEKELQTAIHCVYTNIDMLSGIYDVIFITNPTACHYETLKKAEKYGKHFFVEKPVFVSGDEDIKGLEIPDEKKVYVACPLRYMNVIKYVKENVELSKVRGVRCISSSYLPDWRPADDYRKSYSARKEMGGGVSIDLVHEWDYICHLFGVPRCIYTLMSKKSNLEVNTEDIAIYIAEYETCLLELHLDYFGRFPMRKMELLCEDDTIEVDLLLQTVTYLKEKKIIDMFEDRNMYQKKELEHFFHIIQNKCQNDNDLENACRTIRIARGVL